MTTVTNIAQLNAAIVAADGVTAPGTVVTITLGNDIRFPSGVMRGAPRIHAQWKANDFGGARRTFETQMISLWKESAWLR